jgi:hypothetical protein
VGERRTGGKAIHDVLCTSPFGLQERRDDGDIPLWGPVW